MPSPSSNDSSTSTRPSNPKPNSLPTLDDRRHELRSQIRHANSATNANHLTGPTVPRREPTRPSVPIDRPTPAVAAKFVAPIRQQTPPAPSPPIRAAPPTDSLFFSKILNHSA